MERSESTVRRSGMRIDWDVPIRMDDGIAVRADVFRPDDDGQYPVIITYGPYGKGLHFADLYGEQWDLMCSLHPDVPAGSSNAFQNWEVVDPEKWVPDGYVCIRVDSRGSGRSPGLLDPWSRRQAEDFAHCIDWAGVQPWSNGKVAINGISYYAMNAWQTAALQPKHLAAIVTWEGAADIYRDMAYHGGILCNGFADNWSRSQVYPLQHGVGSNGHRSRFTGDWVAGPVTLTKEQLAGNRRDFFADVKGAALATDEFWTSRMPDWSKVTVPILSAANWGGQGLHPRGNFEGFANAASGQKWLEVHGREHWTEFYTDYGLDLQKRFLGHFLKGEDTGWEAQPPVLLQVRYPGEVFVERAETEWPLIGTEWTPLYLDAGTSGLVREVPEAGSAAYDGMGDGLTFVTPPMPAPTEVTGPVAAKLFVESETEDADFFLVVRVFSPDLKEVVFAGALDPNTPVGQGWLRASHRKLDAAKSEAWRPYHTHDEVQPLVPGKVYELDIEIVPTSIVVPEGYRIALSVRGRDYVYPGGPSAGLKSLGQGWHGCGPFTHTDGDDRRADVFGGRVRVHTGRERASYLLLPVIPER